MTSKAGYNLS